MMSADWREGDVGERVRRAGMSWMSREGHGAVGIGIGRGMRESGSEGRGGRARRDRINHHRLHVYLRIDILSMSVANRPTKSEVVTSCPSAS